MEKVKLTFESIYKSDKQSKTTDDINPKVLIRRIRDLCPTKMIEICTNGSCYKFYKILKTIYPSAKAFFNEERNHIYTKIGNAYYDIYGKVENDLDVGDELTLEDSKYCSLWEF